MPGLSFQGKTWVALGLGTNLGNRIQNLAYAGVWLTQHLRPLQAYYSSVFETEPVGYARQPYFLNAVIALQLTQSPIDVHATLLECERVLGRKKSFRNGPRVLDCDFLLYGNTCFEQSDLVLPHPRLHERLFVLRPLIEVWDSIDSQFLHPQIPASLSDLLAACEATSPSQISYYSAFPEASKR